MIPNNTGNTKSTDLDGAALADDGAQADHGVGDGAVSHGHTLRMCARMCVSLCLCVRVRERTTCAVPWIHGASSWRLQSATDALELSATEQLVLTHPEYACVCVCVGERCVCCIMLQIAVGNWCCHCRPRAHPAHACVCVCASAACVASCCK